LDKAEDEEAFCDCKLGRELLIDHVTRPHLLETEWKSREASNSRVTGSFRFPRRLCESEIESSLDGPVALRLCPRLAPRFDVRVFATFFRRWPAVPSVGSRGVKPKASAGPGVLPIFFNTRLPLFAFPTPYHNVVSAPSWFFGLAVFPRRSSFQCQNRCLQWLAMLFFVENSSAEAPSVSIVAPTNNCDRP
jgi:hypothetical protein